MNEQKNGNIPMHFELEQPIIERSVSTELSDDFTLPDYMPEIRRVISLTAAVAPPSRYIGRGEAEFAGAIRYRMLYEGESRDGSHDDGGIWCAELPAEYDFRLSSDVEDDAGSPGDVRAVIGTATARAEGLGVRVTSARRVNARSRVRLSASLRSGRNCGCVAAMADAAQSSVADGDICRLWGRDGGGVTMTASGEPVELSDVLPLSELGPGAGDGDIRVISSRGEVFIRECMPAADGVVCRGELQVCLLICRDGESERPSRAVRRLPFDIVLPFDSDIPNGTEPIGCRAWGDCVMLTCSVTENGIVTDAAVAFNAEVEGVLPFGYIRDLFSRTQAVEISRRTIGLRRPFACFNGNLTVSGRENLEALSVDPGIKITDVWAVIPEDKAEGEVLDGRIVIVFPVVFTLLIDDGAGLTSHDVTLSCRYTSPVETDASDGKYDINPVFGVSGCSARLDGDGVAFSGEVSVAVSAAERSHIDTVGEMRFGEPLTATGRTASITLCYPSADDSLWRVAKRYRSDPAEIAAANKLPPAVDSDSPSSLGGAKFLLI